MSATEFAVAIDASMIDLRPTQTVDRDCFFMLLQQSGAIEAQLRQIDGGSTIKHVNVGDIRQISSCRSHRSPEQRAIAEALSDVDALLGGLDRLIAKKRDLKQAAMQQLLTGQTRLPGFHGEWEVKRLGELPTSQGRTTASTTTARRFGRRLRDRYIG